MSDEQWMGEAILQARLASDLGEVPVGAIVVRGASEVLARAHNRKEIDSDPLGHAEILALRQAANRLGSWRLTHCTIFVTLEPCAMCAGAMVQSRVERLVYAADDPKAGFCGSLGNLVEDERLNHRLQVTSGPLQDESTQLLKEFFAALRPD
ncbi:MAG: tRNA adenosine(34) deaminase TadA [Acidobacteriota bacterium]|nr:tRNA adenosine(34) deaminase TadA [Acidobacteriota bacterium]